MTGLNRFFIFLLVSTLLFGYLRGPVPPSDIPTPPCTEVSNPQYLWSRSDFKWSFFGGSVWGPTVPKGFVEGACWVEDEREIVDAIQKTKHPFLIIAAHGFMDGDVHRFDIGGRDIGSAQFTNWDKPVLFATCMGNDKEEVEDVGFPKLLLKIKEMKESEYSQYLGTEGKVLLTDVTYDIGVLLEFSNKAWNALE